MKCLKSFGFFYDQCWVIDLTAKVEGAEITSHLFILFNSNLQAFVAVLTSINQSQAESLTR